MHNSAGPIVLLNVDGAAPPAPQAVPESGIAINAAPASAPAIFNLAMGRSLIAAN